MPTNLLHNQIILPPPLDVYNSADELFQSVQRFANSQGYVLVKKRNRKDKCSELKNMELSAQDALKSMINEPAVTLQNPDVVRTKGRFSGALNQQQTNSTKRDPSGFKLVDNKV
ncbi:8390_t:CDS:2 [Dentiscutata erythropus]|uniref:8390_t:CDS:1 n=1 Tax=Dentiscutata erythropus TaxID=1348616 RepID=A0A9N9EKH0_9GLOM|nr:8390_t:CDS:2 [Dentiscutata erythropus]